MNQTERNIRIDQFIRERGITHCPTACVARTVANPTAADRMALADHYARQEAARNARRQRAA